MIVFYIFVEALHNTALKASARGRACVVERAMWVGGLKLQHGSLFPSFSTAACIRDVTRWRSDALFFAVKAVENELPG